MECRFQRFFLSFCLLSAMPIAVSAQDLEQQSPESAATAETSGAAFFLEEPSVRASDLNSEVFELGVFTGIINIGDFGSEWVFGLSANFQASENFFLQYNYLQTEADLSSFELNQGSYFSGNDRTLTHYDLLVGYNLFQGEMYPVEGVENLSSFYMVGGVGDTRFGSEANFTYTLGVGYQIAIERRYILRLDYRSHLYESSLIRSTEERTQNTLFSVGLNYLF